MAYSFEIRQEAVKEFTDVFVWYEEQQTGLGESFKIKVYNKLNQVCNNPLHYRSHYRNFHESLTDTFPFIIVYTIDEKKGMITVIAIFHTSRNPKKKFRK